MLWIVQKYVSQDRCWRDVQHSDDLDTWHVQLAPWEGETAGDAFNTAVLANPLHRLQATSYRVLPFTGGATFNCSVNVEANEHETAVAS